MEILNKEKENKSLSTWAVFLFVSGENIFYSFPKAPRVWIVEANAVVSTFSIWRGVKKIETLP